jgi:hypothetical protein
VDGLLYNLEEINLENVLASWTKRKAFCVFKDVAKRVMGEYTACADGEVYMRERSCCSHSMLALLTSRLQFN